MKRTARKAKADIELVWPSGEFTSDPKDVAGIFATNYEKLGRDAPPPGHSFSGRARRDQDTKVAEILERDVCRGRIGHDVTVVELRRVIRKLEYGKASGPDFISTDLLKIIVEDEGESDTTIRILASLCSWAVPRRGSGASSPIVSQILEIYNSDGKSNEYNEVNNIISSIDHYLNDNNEQIVDTNQDAAMLPKSQIPKSKKNNKEWDL